MTEGQKLWFNWVGSNPVDRPEKGRLHDGAATRGPGVGLYIKLAV